MPANVETMFYTRTEPWHGLGTRVEEASTSEAALIYAGLDWEVIQVPGYKVNLRDRDGAVLGIVSDRYRVVQNAEAFRFTDDLLGEGVTYETAGSLNGGRKTWMLAKLPQRYIISGDEITPYLVVMNSHDGSSGIKVAMTPIRVVCQNTLNLALTSAKRIWTTKHTTNVMGRVHDLLSDIRLSDRIAKEFLDEMFPVTDDMSDLQRRNNSRMREDLEYRYYDAPDLDHIGKNGYRFINAVSDFATHAEPIRKTKNYNENLFQRTVEGNPLIDKAYKMVLATA